MQRRCDSLERRFGSRSDGSGERVTLEPSSPGPNPHEDMLAGSPSVVDRVSLDHCRSRGQSCEGNEAQSSLEDSEDEVEGVDDETRDGVRSSD